MTERGGVGREDGKMRCLREVELRGWRLVVRRAIVWEGSLRPESPLCWGAAASEPSCYSHC